MAEDFGALKRLIAIFDPYGPVQQARAARLALALLEEDPLQATAVFEEVNSDPRGEVVALQALVMTLLTSLCNEWTRGGDVAGLVEVIRAQLLLSARDQKE